jgi:hypothetical protein
MDVVTAVITAQGACTMTTSAESQTASAASAAGQEQKPEKKASAAPQNHLRLATAFGPLRQFVLAHPPS